MGKVFNIGRAALRRIFVWLVVGTISAVLFGLVGEAAVKLATKWGWFTKIDEKWERGMSALFDILTSPWMVGIALLSVGLLVGASLDLLIKKREETKPEAAPLTEIRGRIFMNEPVSLDGFRYVQCEFHAVNFRHAGGDFKVDNCKMFEPLVITPTTIELVRYSSLLFELGKLSQGVMGTDGPIFPKTIRRDTPERNNG
jgi:hypothetical protein